MHPIGDWPGNVRELRNEIMRIMVSKVGGGNIGSEHISGVIKGVSASSFREKMERYEKYLLEEYLRETSGNIDDVSELTGIPRSTLYYMIRKHSLKVKSATRI